MSDYIGSTLALAAVVAAIIGMMMFSGQGSGGGEISIVPEAVAAVPGGPDYGWKVATPQYVDAGDAHAEYY